MIKHNTLSCCELETLVMEYIAAFPRSTIEDIASGIGYDYGSVYRMLEGRLNSRSLIGLVNTGAVTAKPGLGSKGRLAWVYTVG